MEWRHTSSLRPKKFKSQRSAQKVMVTAFWDDKGIILLDNHEIKVLLLFCLIFWNVAVPWTMSGTLRHSRRLEKPLGRRDWARTWKRSTFTMTVCNHTYLWQQSGDQQTGLDIGPSSTVQPTSGALRLLPIRSNERQSSRTTIWWHKWCESGYEEVGTTAHTWNFFREDSRVGFNNGANELLVIETVLSSTFVSWKSYSSNMCDMNHLCQLIKK